MKTIEISNGRKVVYDEHGDTVIIPQGDYTGDDITAIIKAVGHMPNIVAGADAEYLHEVSKIAKDIEPDVMSLEDFKKEYEEKMGKPFESDRIPDDAMAAVVWHEGEPYCSLFIKTIDVDEMELREFANKRMVRDRVAAEIYKRRSEHGKN